MQRLRICSRCRSSLAHAWVTAGVPRSASSIGSRSVKATKPSVQVKVDIEKSKTKEKSLAGSLELIQLYINKNLIDSAWDVYSGLMKNQHTASKIPRSVHSDMLMALHPSAYTQFSILSNPEPDATGKVLLFRALGVKQNMQKSGYKLNPIEYGKLMSAARASRNKRLGESLIKEIVQSPDKLDTYMVNSYIAMQTGTSLDFSVKNFKPSNGELGDNIENLIQSLVMQKGFICNSMTFELLLLARSRDLDVGRVRSILRSVWGLDIQNSKATVPSDSPLHPTEHTMLAIATGLGYNGLVADALAYVREIERVYAMRIDQDTWEALMQWSRYRSPLSDLPAFFRSDKALVAVADPDLSKEIWYQVVREYPSVKLSSRLWRHLIKHEIRKGDLKEANAFLREWVLYSLRDKPNESPQDATTLVDFRSANLQKFIADSIDRITKKLQHVPKSWHGGNPLALASDLKDVWSQVIRKWSSVGLVENDLSLQDESLLSRSAWNKVQDALPSKQKSQLQHR